MTHFCSETYQSQHSAIFTPRTKHHKSDVLQTENKVDVGHSLYSYTSNYKIKILKLVHFVSLSIQYL